MSAREQRLYSLLQQAAHRLKTTADRSLLDSGGITTAQAAVLAILSDTDGMSQKELAQKLRLNESAMTAMIGRLAEKRWVKRVRDPDDARARRVHLTRAGRDAVGRIERPFGEINDLLDRTLGRERTNRFAEDLRDVIEALETDAT
jgi:DNA-binding MarR family transcriptional regulator